jgi:hypothetical protein
MDKADHFTEVLLPNKQTGWWGARIKERAETVPHRAYAGHVQVMFIPNGP